MRKYKAVLGAAIFAGCYVTTGCAGAYAGEGFFDKIGDGWEKGPVATWRSIYQAANVARSYLSHLLGKPSGLPRWGGKGKPKGRGRKSAPGLRFLSSGLPRPGHRG